MLPAIRATVVAIAVAVLLPTAALASSAPAVGLSVTPSTVAPGQAVTLSGSGCPAGTRVLIDLQGALWSTTAGADGRYRTSFVVPAGTNPGPIRVQASCGDRRSAPTTLTVGQPTSP